MLKLSFCVLVLCYSYMSMPRAYSSKGFGWSVPTRKRRSRRERPSKLLVQPLVSTLCINPHVIIEREHCNGTAALSVVDGLVYGKSHPRKRFVDFRTFLETVVVAEAQRRGVQTIALVLDNGPTHASKQLPRWVKELATTSDGKLTVQLYWLPVNASWLDQIEIWFSLLQRKLLQPNHFTCLDELQQAIADFIARHNQTAKPLQWSYTVEKLERKLGTNSR
jgi:hypothetical protein